MKANKDKGTSVGFSKKWDDDVKDKKKQTIEEYLEQGLLKHASELPSSYKYIIGSYFFNEPSEWGWKYGFTLNTEISHDKLRELTDLIENYLNLYP